MTTEAVLDRRLAARLLQTQAILSFLDTPQFKCEPLSKMLALLPQSRVQHSGVRRGYVPCTRVE
jgi:hypothetical protein